MKVAISGYVGNKLTGIGRVLINVLQELAIQYPEDIYYVFKNYDFKDYDSLSIYNNIKLIDVHVSKESGFRNILWHQYLFQKLIKKYSCDVAYIPNFTLLLWKVVPTIVTIHDLIEYNVEDKFSKLRMFYRKKICDPLMANRSDYILTVSKSSYNDIKKYLKVPESKLSITPNATDKSFFKKYEKNEVLALINKFELCYKKYLLFVGTIDHPGKNIITVIDTYFKLRSENKLQNYKLVIIGKNGFNSHVIYDHVNSSAYKADVIFTGYLPDQDLPKIYAGASVMLYLSLFEGFGLPVLEAMSCATPVICPNTSCFPEIVEDLDICVCPTDINSVSDKIEKILSDDVYYKKLSNSCYEKSLKYSWSETAKLYHNVFSQQSDK